MGSFARRKPSKPSRGRKRKKKELSKRGRFPERVAEHDGRLIDYKEVELLRKFMTSSHKMMSRKRSGTSAREQRALRIAVKQARFMALVPYSGT